MKMTVWDRNYYIRRYAYGPCLKLLSHAMYRLSPVISEKLYDVDRPIFVIGCSRSGTTVFMDYFEYHADLCNWSEAAQIMELNYYNGEKDHLMEEMDVNEFDRFRIRLFFGLKTRLTGKKRFINKHPQNSLRIRYIKEIFPNAFFIHLIRDGRAVVESNYSRAKIDVYRSFFPFGDFPKPPLWRKYLQMSSLEQFAFQWRDIVLYIRRTAESKLSAGDYIEIRYEDFCKDVHGVFNHLDNFCALDSNRRLFGKIPNRLEARNERWKRTLSVSEKERMNAIIGSLNRELGYS